MSSLCLFSSAERMQELQSFVGHEGRIMRAIWGPLNQTLISAGEDGSLRLWDVEVSQHPSLSNIAFVALPPVPVAYPRSFAVRRLGAS